MRFLFLSGIFFLSAFSAPAQRAAVWSAGGFVHFGPNTYSSIATIPAAPPQNPYSNTINLNIGLGGQLTWAPFFKSNSFLKDVSFGARFGGDWLSRQLNSRDSSVTLVGGVITPLVFAHDVEADFATFLLEVGIHYNLFKNFSVGISPHIRFITSALYTKSQRIASPGDIDFVEGGTSKREFESKLPERATMLASATFAA
ncbi:MAG TPA: hypothetical protein VEC36_12640, partial [Patescibacteria group bacterium]|nr:hypothetical protein [Patescibacteria group bacterium]